jgi:flagellar hook-basal body complex protein FliE
MKMADINPIKPVAGLAEAAAKGPTQILNAEDSFRNLLTKAIDKVNEYQAKAEGTIQKLSTGNIENLHEVMVALEEANITLQFAVQVRNKVVEAYQEIMRMQV